MQPARLRQLTPLSNRQPPLLSELAFSGYQKTPVGTLCPHHSALQRIKQFVISPTLTVSYPKP